MKDEEKICKEQSVSKLSVSSGSVIVVVVVVVVVSVCYSF